MHNLGDEPDVSDAWLIGAARDDPSRFAPVFDRHFQAIYRFAARRLGSEVGKDIAADTFVVALARLKSYDDSRESALSWLYGIASNLIRNHRRTERRRFRLLAKLSNERVSPGWSDDPDRVLSRTVVTRAVAQALGSLSSKEREALLLFVWAELPQAEIARLQQVAPATVRSRIFRARKELREHLARSGQDWDETANSRSQKETCEDHGG